MTTTLFVPDIGDFKNVPVIEILVRPGDAIKAEDVLLTLESDKATIDVPASTAGIVREIVVGIGDAVSAGSPMMVIEAAASAAAPCALPSAAPVASAAPHSPAATKGAAGVPRAAHAGPALRKFARELGINIARVPGSGPKGRLQREDLVAYAKELTAAAGKAPPPTEGNAGGPQRPPWPQIDFARFGPVDIEPLSRIGKISGANLARNWATIPHVTNHDAADVTELEAFRQRLNEENTAGKISLLAFLIKACAAALKKFPAFNASLDGDTLVLKRYVNIGFAADTPNGLTVPVIRGADGKGIVDLAREVAELAALAREGKLRPEQMQGGCFSISSLGGIDGGHFTPIINAPEVAILGVGKARTAPVWDGREFTPRLMLPLSLAWDHRVVDGAAAARFNAYLGQLLADMRRVLL